MTINRISTALFIALGVVSAAPSCLAASALTIIDEPNAFIGVYPNGGTDVYQTSGSTTVGTYWQTNHAYGFIKTGKVYSTINVPYADGGANYVYATGVSGNTVVGIYYGTNLRPYGYSLSAGSFKSLSVPGSILTQATGISGKTIVGITQYQGSNEFGFTYTNGLYTIIDAPDGNQGTIVNGINGNSVVGLYQNNGIQHGFMESLGAFSTIDMPNSAGYTNVSAVSGSAVAGYYRDNSGAYRGFFENLGVFQSVDVIGSTSTIIRGLSKTATGYSVVGNYVMDGRMHGFSLSFSPSAPTVGNLAPKIFASPVPEPNSWATVIFGFFGIGSLLRRGQSDRRISA